MASVVDKRQLGGKLRARLSYQGVWVIKTEETSMAGLVVRSIMPDETAWIEQVVLEQLGGIPIVSPSGVHLPFSLSGFIAVQDGERVGLLNYQIADDACEILTLASLSHRKGIGTALVNAAKNVAKQGKCRRLWVITTNDNLNALRFYQKRGFHLIGVHQNAMEQVRCLKPGVPLLGKDGIPLRDMIELQMLLS